MPSLSITVMAHPKRQAWAREIAKKVGAEIVWDRKNHLWDTCRRSWLAHDFDKDYCLVLQDDVILCENFIEEVKKILKEDYVYSLYSGQFNALKNRIEKAKNEGKDHITTGYIYNEIALCMRSEHVKDMVEWCDKKKPENDHYITRWMQRRSLPAYFPVVSLVDHRDSESIYRENTGREFKRKGERKALYFKDNQ